jgi:hypothetical protein
MATEVPHRWLGEWRSTLFAGGLRVGNWTTQCEEKRHREPKYKILMKAISSLVSGFDVSTENQVDFKRIER